jgi:hypothetical protein
MMKFCSVSDSTFTVLQYSHTVLTIAPVAKNKNAVIFNVFKNVDSPRYLRLLLADWPRCGTTVATMHCWLQMKRIDSYAELSSHSARICQCKSTYITFKYSEGINFLYGRRVLEDHAAVAGLSHLFQQQAVSGSHWPLSHGQHLRTQKRTHHVILNKNGHIHSATNISHGYAEVKH